MMISQSRTGTKSLAALAIAASVGVVGCSHPTTTSASSVGETSSSVATQPLVDVSQVWATEPLPACPKPPVVYNGDVSAGLELPDKASVARILAGAKSPAPTSWVREKLGWVTKHLSQTRADIIDANAPGDDSMLKTFDMYVKHVRAELEVGRDSSDPSDAIYPDGCA
ncbi:hypothetical protein [Mycobacteroides abscessus]|uniref:hypothetical protein n=1 Tax=Mycobacteroides abscessus TaxID=36809 RepID=UPI001F310E1C|nr:hypothetical protein [Mycobacteroides abscessus]MDO3064366.1 hypothetical protein [Mycobacteroides abscessus subsp. abscessus]MDO3158776.1 hypothetical protein [Mycobacteroides abscessus subsp. abscessus]MDO3236944.1 hypothetical protein [Mycobacteroides abscessus subsp. abscessus]